MMNPESTSHYQKIAKAIDYIQRHHTQQPSLDEVAQSVHLSPFHFQRLFQEWAGVSPKQFSHYISLQHAKKILNDQKATLLDTAEQTGFSGTGRLHDLFIKIEGMTPGQYKNKGEDLVINYSYQTSTFGDLLVASTNRGVCYLGFVDSHRQAFEELTSRFPKASFQQQSDTLQEAALNVFKGDWSQPHQIKCHLKGTDFQLKVWEALLSIPSGHLTTYGSIAQSINRPKASRAVGTAIGNNPLAFLIPCHRVIQQSGLLGGYRWGTTRKKAIIGWEASQAPEVG